MEFFSKIFLKTVRFENFKSYIGQNEVGPCHPALNSIIGPNGCGKSNFFDAILFVLGKRAVEIRFRHLSDIISFSRFKKYKLTSVTISFRSDLLGLGDNFKGFSETLITRKVWKTNFSIYFLNGREVGFQSLAKIFLDKGIFLKNNRFLVQQGEIEKISAMKPIGKNIEEMGFLEYSEEIFGSFRYTKLINQLKKENDRLTNEKKINKGKSFKILNIEEDKQFFDKKKNIFPGKIKILKQIYYLFRVLLAQIAARESFFYKKQQQQQNFLQLNAQLASLFEKIKKINFSGFEKIKRLTGKIFLTRTEIFRKLHKNKREKILIRNPNLPNLKLTDLIKTTEKEKKKRILKINEKKAKLFILKETQSPYFPKILLSSYNKDTLSSDFFFWKNRIKSLGFFIKNFIEFFQKNDQIFSPKRKGFFFSIFYLMEEKNTFFGNKKKFSNTFFRFHFHSQCKKFSLENRNFFRSMETFSRIKIIEENRFTKSKIDSKIFKDPREKLLCQNNYKQGFIGQLGSLGYVNFDLFLPILSVLKTELESLVVGKISESIPLVESFNGKKLGRVKILILEKIKLISFKRKKLFNSRRLLDKIFTIEKFKPAFNLFINDTLIVENLSQGIHQVFDSENRKRIVTINGEIIEESGIFSGGGNNKKNYNLLKKTETNFFRWMEVFKFLKIQKKSSENFKFKNSKENQVFLNHFSNLGITKELRIFSFPNRINKENIFDCVKLNIYFSTNCFLFQKFLSLILEKNVKIFKFRKKNNLSFLLWIKKRYISKLNIYSSLTIFEFFRKNYLIEKSPKILSQQKNQEIQYSLYFLRLNHRQITSRKKKKNVKKNQKILNFFQNVSKAFNWWIRNSSLFLNSILPKVKNFNNVLKKLRNLKTERETKIISYKQKINFSRKKLGNLGLKKNRIRFEIKKIFFFFKNYKKLPRYICFFRFVNVFKINFQDLYWEKFLEFVPNMSFGTSEKKEIIISLKSKKKSLFPVEIFLYTVLKKIEFFKLKRIQIYKKKKLKSKKDFSSRIGGQVHLQRLTDFIQNLFLLERKSNLIYSLIAGGGVVEIEIINEIEPFSQGVLLSIRPPNKTWKMISQLSGGEKTIGSLAIIFSFQILKPVLWYLFDEIDAALDFKNVSKISTHIVSCSKESQILIVSLRTNMFDKADHMFGIGKINDETKTIILRKTKMTAS